MENAHHILLANQLRNLARTIHDRGSVGRIKFSEACNWKDALEKIADEFEGTPWDPAERATPDDPGDGSGDYELTDLGRSYEP